jgi:dTDP-4-dehydrorhamnose reductase
VYGASKLAGELAVTSTGGRALILRTAWVVSPWRHNFVKTMLRLARDRDSIGVVSDQVGSPTSAKDIARAIQTIALRMVQDSAAPTGIYHYVNSGRASWADLAEHVFTVSRELGGSSAAVKRISTADYPTPVRRPGFSVLSTDKIERDFGIRPDDWRDSVKDVVQSIILAEGI